MQRQQTTERESGVATDDREIGGAPHNILFLPFDNFRKFNGMARESVSTGLAIFCQQIIVLQEQIEIFLVVRHTEHANVPRQQLDWTRLAKKNKEERGQRNCFFRCKNYVWVPHHFVLDKHIFHISW